VRDDEIIRVQAEWSAWESAEIRIDDLEDIHWLRPPGAPQALLHGYVWCASIVNGAIPHECRLHDAPHWLRVCVLKKHVVPSVYVELVRRGYVEIARRAESGYNGARRARAGGARR
jgi:hypothetical protein